MLNLEIRGVGGEKHPFPRLKIPLENLIHQNFTIKTSKINHWYKRLPKMLHDSYRNPMNSWFHRRTKASDRPLGQIKSQTCSLKRFTVSQQKKNGRPQLQTCKYTPCPDHRTKYLLFVLRGQSWELV